MSADCSQSDCLLKSSNCCNYFIFSMFSTYGSHFLNIFSLQTIYWIFFVYILLIFGLWNVHCSYITCTFLPPNCRHNVYFVRIHNVYCLWLSSNLLYIVFIVIVFIISYTLTLVIRKLNTCTEIKLTCFYWNIEISTKYNFYLKKKQRLNEFSK